MPGLSQPQPYHQTASSHKSSSSILSSASDKEDAGESRPGEQIQQAVTLQWTRPSCPQGSVAHTYTGGPNGKKDNEASHIKDGSQVHSAFSFCILQKLSLCWWWSLTTTTITTQTDLTMDPLLNLTLLKLKCLCFIIDNTDGTGQQWTSCTHLSTAL